MKKNIIFIKKGTKFVINKKFQKEIQWGGMSSAMFTFKKEMVLTITDTERTTTVIYMTCPDCKHLGAVRMEYQELSDKLISKTLGILLD